MNIFFKRKLSSLFFFFLTFKSFTTIEWKRSGFYPTNVNYSLECDTVLPTNGDLDYSNWGHPVGTVTNVHQCPSTVICWDQNV